MNHDQTPISKIIIVAIGIVKQNWFSIILILITSIDIDLSPSFLKLLVFKFIFL